MEIDPAAVTERLKGTLSDLLGMRVVEATPDRVVAELVIRDEIRTVGGSLHGGTLMALADTIGATATALNLPAGAEHDHPRVQDQFLRGGARGRRARGVDAAPSGQAHPGLADARHRCERATALAHHPDPDGPDVTRRKGLSRSAPCYHSSPNDPGRRKT